MRTEFVTWLSNERPCPTIYRFGASGDSVLSRVVDNAVAAEHMLDTQSLR